MMLDSLNASFANFVVSPTAGKQDELIKAAEAYREAWIEDRSFGQAMSKTAVAAEDRPTRYKLIKSVKDRSADGTEVTLALQSRTSDKEDATWPVVSWRTRLNQGGPNRRFYISGGEAWTIKADLALKMLRKLRDEGGFEDRFKDIRRRPNFIADVADDGNAGKLMHECTMADEEWSAQSIVVALTDPNEDWRKVMIVDPNSGVATFRSLTKRATYRPRKTLRAESCWFLDNSMQDANVQQAQVFLEKLEQILS